MNFSDTGGFGCINNITMYLSCTITIFQCTFSRHRNAIIPMLDPLLLTIFYCPRYLFVCVNGGVCKELLLIFLSLLLESVA